MKPTLSLFKLSAVAVLALFAATDVYAATVSSGAIEGADLKANVYYRHFVMGWAHGQRKVRLTAGDTVKNEAGSMRWDSGKPIVLKYDVQAKKLSTIVIGGNGTNDVVTEIDNVDLGALNYLELDIKVSQAAVQFNHVKLNGEHLPTHQFSGAASGAKWHITGEELSQDFVLEGNIVLSGGMQPGFDHNYLQISVGYVDQTGPEVDGLGVNPNPAILNGTTTLRATVSDANTGNNNINSAQYSLNGGNWEPMDAQDETFDSVSEDVIAELAATQLGFNEVCVRGTDAKGNVTTPPTCTTFMVTYQFEGFAAPLNNELINTAKAGQVVPAKWRLTDANGLPIEDATSFKGFYSYPIDCESTEHSPHDAVEEQAPGNSGLQYSGNGEWQYNWKTPKSYWGTCRAMYVEFNSGAISPITQFQFK